MSGLLVFYANAKQTDYATTRLLRQGIEATCDSMPSNESSPA